MAGSRACNLLGGAAQALCARLRCYPLAHPTLLASHLSPLLPHVLGPLLRGGHLRWVERVRVGVGAQGVVSRPHAGTYLSMGLCQAPTGRQGKRSRPAPPTGRHSFPCK